MSGSGEFQVLESSYSGKNSHVPSQLAVTSKSTIATEACHLIHGVCLKHRTIHVRFNTHTLSRNSPLYESKCHRFGSSAGTPYQGILHSTNPSATGSVPVQASTGRPVARGEERIGSTTPLPMSARRPSTINSFLPAEVPQNSMAGQRRLQLPLLRDH